MVRFIYDRVVKIELYKQILEEAGISCIVKNEFGESVAAGFAEGIPGNADLYVDEDNLKQAEDIINDYLDIHKARNKNNSDVQLMS